MGKSMVVAKTEAVMAALRQLKGERIDFAATMLPFELKDNLLHSFNGNVVGTWEGEDQFIIDAKLFNQKVCTDAWLIKVFKDVNEFLGSAGEREEPDEEREQSDEECEQPELEEENTEPEDEKEQILQLIMDGKLKKAKKLLKKAKKLLKRVKPNLSKKEYKKLKKEL